MIRHEVPTIAIKVYHNIIQKPCTTVTILQSIMKYNSQTQVHKAGDMIFARQSIKLFKKLKVLGENELCQ